MRIISKKHDYYDSVMIHGTDPDIIFNRKLVKHNDSDKFSPEIEKYFREPFSLIDARRLSIEPFAVIFCGEIYKGIIVYTRKKKQKENWCYAVYDDYDRVHCYNYEETLKAFNDAGYNIKEELSRRIYIDGKSVIMSAERRIELFFEDSGSDKFMSLMVEKKCPVLLVEKTSSYDLSLKVIENPILKDVSFFRVFDSYTTYQRLSMFIGGVLPRKARPIVTISDKDKIAKRGFDKWSFRKMKGD